MAKKSTSWEFRIYDSLNDYDRYEHSFIQTDMSKREAIWEAKQFVKLNQKNNAIVKIQTYDREQIEVYTASNRFGQIIFTKKKQEELCGNYSLRTKRLKS